MSWTTVTLPVGRYELICNVPNHPADGMYEQLTVTWVVRCGERPDAARRLTRAARLCVDLTLIDEVRLRQRAFSPHEVSASA